MRCLCAGGEGRSLRVYRFWLCRYAQRIASEDKELALVEAVQIIVGHFREHVAGSANVLVLIGVDEVQGFKCSFSPGERNGFRTALTILKDLSGSIGDARVQTIAAGSSVRVLVPRKQLVRSWYVLAFVASSKSLL